MRFVTKETVAWIRADHVWSVRELLEARRHEHSGTLMFMPEGERGKQRAQVGPFHLEISRLPNGWLWRIINRKNETITHGEAGSLQDAKDSAINAILTETRATLPSGMETCILQITYMSFTRRLLKDNEES
jgi:hypothetical protein